MSKGRLNLLAGGLSMLAIAAAAVIAFFIYDTVPHLEDEFAYLWQAEVLADGRMLMPSPVEPRSELVPFVVDHNGVRFGKYPPGWPLVLALGARVGFPWLVNPLLAGTAVWLMYRLASSIAGERRGLLAAALLLLSPMFLMLSGSYMSHMLSLVLVLVFCTAWFCLFMEEQEGERWIYTAAAGCSLGLLVITRPLTAAGTAAPFFIHGLVLLVRGGGRNRWDIFSIGAIVLAFTSLIPLWQAVLTGDPWLNPYTLWWPYDSYGFGEGVGVAAGGHSLYHAWWNTKFSLQSASRDMFGWFSISWLFLAPGLWVLRRNIKTWMITTAGASLVIVYAGYWVGSWLYGPRYYFEGMPAACVLTAAGISLLAGTGDLRGTLAVIRRSAAVVLVVLLIGSNAAVYLPVRLQESGGVNGMSADSRWLLEEIGEEPAVVVLYIGDSWWEYGLYVPLAPPFTDRPLRIVMDRGAEANQAVLENCPGWRVFHVDLSKGKLVEIGLP